MYLNTNTFGKYLSKNTLYKFNMIYTEFFTIFRAIKIVSSEILIHHAKQGPYNFPIKKKIPVFILEKYLSEKRKRWANPF